MEALKLLLAFACSVSVGHSAGLPPTFKICPRNSKNLAQCVKESIEFIRPRLKTGDFGNGLRIDPLEPFKVEDIVINRGEGFYVHLSNLKAFGATNFKIEKLRFNVNDFKVDAIVDVPKIEAFGKYKLQMMLGILNLKGEGNMKATIEKVKLKISMAGPKYMKNGQQYVRFDKSNVAVKIHSLQINFENLFPNDHVLNNLGNSLVNQNIDLFVKDIEPALQKSLANQFARAANQVLESAPFDAILPP